MSTVDIAAIRARVAAATPGPWVAAKGPLDVELSVYKAADVAFDVWDYPDPVVDGDPSRGEFGPSVRRTPDTELIANVPIDLTALCDEVERLQAQVEELLPWAQHGAIHVALEWASGGHTAGGVFVTQDDARRIARSIGEGEFGEVQS